MTKRATRAEATNKLMQSAIVAVPQAGRWDVSVTYSAAGEQGQVCFVLDVDEPLPNWFAEWPWFTWPIGVVLLFTVHQALLRRTSARARRRARGPNAKLRSHTPYSSKVVLSCRCGYRPELDALVEQFVADGVKLVAVVGDDCSRVEGIVDELVVVAGSDDSRMIITSSHPGETLAEVIEYVRAIKEPSGEPQVVEV